MMVAIEFLGPINEPNLKLEISSLKEPKRTLKQDESLKEQLELCAICLNGAMVFDGNVSLKSGDTIALLPPIRGGWMLETHKGVLDISPIYTKWYESFRGKNCRVFLSFCGMARGG